MKIANLSAWERQQKGGRYYPRSPISTKLALCIFKWFHTDFG
jgi:hypothetical protein